MELHQLVPNLSAPIVKPYMYNKLALEVPQNSKSDNKSKTDKTSAA